jgi:hypothetical protein
VKTQPRDKKLIDISHPGPSSSPAMQSVAEDNWSHFGDHERLDLKKKLVEHPHKNPIDPKTFKPQKGSGAGGV